MRITIVTLVLAALEGVCFSQSQNGGSPPAGPATAGPLEIACPATVDVDQKLKAPVDGWTGIVGNSPNRLANVAFYDGPPGELASLVPTKEGKRNGREYATWNFQSADEVPRPAWIVCEYSDTQVALYLQLPGSVTECTVTYNPRRGPSGYPGVEGIVCQQATKRGEIERPARKATRQPAEREFRAAGEAPPIPFPSPRGADSASGSKRQQ